MNPMSLKNLAQKTFSGIQTNLEQVVSTTGDFKEEVLTRLDEKKEEVGTFVAETSNSMANVTLQTVQEAERIAHNLKFENLPKNLQRKFI